MGLGKACGPCRRPPGPDGPAAEGTERALRAPWSIRRAAAGLRRSRMAPLPAGLNGCYWAIYWAV